MGANQRLDSQRRWWTAPSEYVMKSLLCAIRVRLLNRLVTAFDCLIVTGEPLGERVQNGDSVGEPCSSVLFGTLSSGRN